MIRIDLGGVGLSSSASIESTLAGAKVQAVLYQYTRDLVEDRDHLLDTLEASLDYIEASGERQLLVDLETLDTLVNGEGSSYNMGAFTAKEKALLRCVLAEATRLQCVDVLFY